MKRSKIHDDSARLAKRRVCGRGGSDETLSYPGKIKNARSSHSSIQGKTIIFSLLFPTFYKMKRKTIKSGNSVLSPNGLGEEYSIVLFAAMLIYKMLVP